MPGPGLQTAGASVSPQLSASRGRRFQQLRGLGTHGSKTRGGPVGTRVGKDAE